MLDLKNPHDKFFQEVFSREEVARDFFASQLPPHVVQPLDLSSLELLKDSFVDEDLREHFSDLRYKIDRQGGRKVFVYLLLEHKSFEEQFVLFQLLRYRVKIWDARRHTDGLIPILPIIYYLGKRRWSLAPSFHSLFLFPLPEPLRRYVPTFETIVWDISPQEDEKWRVGVLAGIAMLAMKIYLFARAFPPATRDPSSFKRLGEPGEWA